MGVIVLAVGLAVSRGIQHLHTNTIFDPEIFGGIVAVAGVAAAVLGALTKKRSLSQ